MISCPISPFLNFFHNYCAHLFLFCLQGLEAGALLAEPNLSDISAPSTDTTRMTPAALTSPLPGQFTLFWTFCREDPLFLKKIVYSILSVVFISISTILMIRQLVSGPTFSWNHVLNLAVFGVMSLLPFIQYGWNKFTVCRQGLEEFIKTGASRTSYQMTYLSIDVLLRPPIEPSPPISEYSIASASSGSTVSSINPKLGLGLTLPSRRRGAFHHSRLASFSTDMLPLFEVAERNDAIAGADKTD
jgi:hypothetical protein